MKDYTSNNKPKLLDQVRITILAAHYFSSATNNYSSIKNILLFSINKYILIGVNRFIEHNSIKTTVTFTHVLNKGLGIKSPLD
jgi:hypothetical protein